MLSTEVRGFTADKYGFHGSSHRYVVERVAQIMETPKERMRLISCHIGNGVSVTSIRRGQSYYTSMGFTPLAGVTMGTRSDTIDTGIIPYIEQIENSTTAQVFDMLNHHSGLLGVSGISNDVRVLLDHEQRGSKRAHLALE
ncbi:Acetate kinase [Acidibacillus sp. S0AB]|uniref:Acetate kinase n=1 Tax=Sulfoacidibacillus ferrooxidans TaxID=2005001 RepID=A0A9X2AEE8_9BACL|nr:Acetate kinase [Sulfoacidibacillus ferrooxidans]